MSRKTKDSERIQQISIGLHKRQINFLENCRDFNIHKLTRDVLDEQIKLINPGYLEQFEYE